MCIKYKNELKATLLLFIINSTPLGGGVFYIFIVHKVP